MVGCVLGCMKHGGHMGRVYRAKFSAIGERDVLKAYRSLGRPNEAESKVAFEEITEVVREELARFEGEKILDFRASLVAVVESFIAAESTYLGWISPI